MSHTAVRILKAARKPGSKAWSSTGLLRRGLRSLALVVGLILGFSAVTGPAYAQPVKGEAKLTSPAGYARLLLKFQGEVASDVVVAGAILVINFDKPVDVPIDLLADAVPAYVGAVRRDPDGMAIRMALSQKVRVNVMTAGERVFIDLLPEKWTGLPPPLPAEVVKELSERALAAERALRIQKQADEGKKNPPVRVRALVQPTFVRLVFEVPDGVAVSSSLSTNKFMLSFSSALSFDLADAKIAMPSNIKFIDQKTGENTSNVDIGLIGEVDVRAFREEKNYIVDVGFEEAKAPSQAAPKIPLKPDATKTEDKPAANRSTEVAPPNSEQITREIMQATERDAKSGAKAETAEPAKAEVAPEPVIAKPETASQSEAVATPKPLMTAEAPKKANAAESRPMASETVSPPTASPPVDAAQAAKLVEPVAAAKLVPRVKRTSDDLRITFPFGNPTPAAVFKRSDSVWLVFDTDKFIDSDTISRDGGSLINAAASVDLPKGRAVRIRMNKPQLVTLSHDEHSWTLILADKAESPSQPLTVARNMADPKRANVSIALSKPGQIHRIADPEAGDTLTVVTDNPPVHGFVKRQNFVEFSLLESVHGVVVQPNSDDLTAEFAGDKLILSRPGGLTLSSAVSLPERASSGMRTLFDSNVWNENKKADFNSAYDSLLTAASLTMGPKRMTAHLNLARFYLARGFYPEAKGVLDLALSEVQRGEEDVSALVIHAVASALAGRPEQTLLDLANPLVGENFDSQLWKAFAYARQEKWVEAREKFKNAEFAISGLPADLQRIVVVDAFRASLEVKDYPGAGQRSNDFDTIGIAPEQEGAVALLRGRLAEAMGHDKDAVSQYQTAIASSDRAAAAEGQLLDIALRQKHGGLNDDDAMRELETASVLWRGDVIETRNLGMLSRLYVEKGRYSEAFAAARYATRLQPNSEASRKVQDETSALFEELYNSSKGDDLPVVEALALFYEYRDLTPIGRRGDELIRRLADRLVAVDLLDQASELLQYQIDHRLEGAARAQVASRLAMVYLMNRKPERAIAALRTTRIADLAGELRQQRLLLEARAQSDTGRHDLALDIISNLGGREAVRLRSDIYWAARRWRESAEQIELLYGDRWRDFQPLSAIEKSDVIRAAIGYSLAEDAIGLARFREKYNPKMEGGNDRAAFDLAGKPASANSADFTTIAKMAATIDTLDGFLREMKKRFPDAVARAKLPPQIKTDPNPTGALPEIVGLKNVQSAR